MADDEELPVAVPFDLQALPNELLSVLLPHVTHRTFTSLRLTSNRFRSLCDSRHSYLQKIISIPKKSPEIFKFLQTHPVANIKLNNEEVAEKIAKIFAQKLPCERLLSLQTTEFSVLEKFLVLCPDIESIDFMKFNDIRKINLMDIGLKKICIVMDLDIEYLGEELGGFLKGCGKLTEIEMRFPNQEEHLMSPTTFNRCVIQPLLEFLSHRNESKNPLPITLKFTTATKNQNLPFSFAQLKNFLQFSSFLKIIDIPFLSLPSKRDFAEMEKFIDPEILPHLNAVIKSIVTTTADLKTSTMEIERDSFHLSCRHFMPPNAYFKLYLHLPSNKIYLTNPSQLLPRKIDAITITTVNSRANLLLSIGEEDCENFVELLLKDRDLKELRIISEMDSKMELPFLTQDSVNFQNFPGFTGFRNLRILELHFWGKCEKDFGDIFKLTTLVEIYLKKCYKFCDNSLSGVERLEFLEVLSVDGFWEFGDKGLSSVALVGGLRKLEIFDNESQWGGTLAGIEKLTKLSKLETLKINKIPKISMSTIKNTLIPCRSLKFIDIVERGKMEKIVF